VPVVPPGQAAGRVRGETRPKREMKIGRRRRLPFPVADVIVIGGSNVKRTDMGITIVELARLAGVSDTTVSLVLSGKHRGRVSAARRKQILALARKHGYRPNLMARGLVKGRHYRIAVCWGGPLSNEEILGQVHRYERLALFCRGFHAAGYSIELIETDQSLSAERISRELAQRPVDGFVLVGWPEELAAKVLFYLKVQERPALASGVCLGGEELTWTEVDLKGTVRAAVDRLADDGCRVVAFIMLSTGIRAAYMREGFLEAAVGRFGSAARGWLLQREHGGPEDVRALTAAACDSVPRLDGLILYDTYYGGDAIETLRDRGITPGRSCRVIGLGDTLLADRTTPRLSHYGLRIEEQVSFGVEALLEAIANPREFKPRHLLCTPEYIPRET